jgi:hypothetical protein
MIEVAMVFDKDGKAIFWPSVPGSAGSIPDNRNLWDRLWESRDILGGVAHTHPWDGPSGPSGTDVTTFAAIEAGLGQTLVWPIVTMTHISYYERSDGDYRLHLYPPHFEESEEWMKNIEEMRRLSRNGG